jgi:hypothetical protein
MLTMDIFGGNILAHVDVVNIRRLA